MAHRDVDESPKEESPQVSLRAAAEGTSRLVLKSSGTNQTYRSLSQSAESNHRRTSSTAYTNNGVTELAAPEPIDRSRSKSYSLEEALTPTAVEEGSTEGTAWLPSFLWRSSSHIEAAQLPYSNISEPTNMESDEQEKLDTEVNVLSSLATEIYIHSHLIFFSILGTLARLGLEAITTYKNSPISTPVIWANVGGSFFLGFLIEDRRLFREEWGIGKKEWSFSRARSHAEDQTLQEAQNAHKEMKNTIPLYIGLAVGFCGSFTSFSSFIREAFLALANLPPQTPLGRQFGVMKDYPSRNGAYGFEAASAILILHIATSIAGLLVGAHFALALDRFMPTIPFKFFRNILDPAIVFLGVASWIGFGLLVISMPKTSWRGYIAFSPLFSPAGCILRYHASKYLNGRIRGFPLGTFLVNTAGAAIIGACFDLQHSRAFARPGGSSVTCQALEGLMEGFCGALTTVSSWVAELNALRRRNAYIYGIASVAAGLCLLVVIIGPLAWTTGLSEPVCR